MITEFARTASHKNDGSIIFHVFRCGLKSSQIFSRHEERRGKVNIHRRVPLLERHLYKGYIPRNVDAMIDDDDVNGSKGRSCAGEKVNGIFFFRKVGLNGLDLIWSVFGKDRLQDLRV